jgi:prephenate dehydratase/chorismate mutase
MKLEEIRGRIDAIDKELVALLGERMELGLRTRPFKEQAHDPDREALVIGRAGKVGPLPLDPGFVSGLFAAIVAETCKAEERAPMLVAFQGEHGAYGEAAAGTLAPGGVPMPCSEFDEVFRGVEEGAYDAGVVPVENSLEGAVGRVDELLAGTTLHVTGETVMPIRHCLLALPGTDHRELRVAYSHPQALAQCRGFLSRNGLEARPHYDTAGAARMLARERLHGAAAIASASSAALYGLDVLKEGIEDGVSNRTRFVCVSREPAPRGDKCSLVFSTVHEAGRLHGVIELFAAANLDLTRIASMPMRAEPGSYCFFLDFAGSSADERVSRVLEEVGRRTVRLRFLGCYPSAAGRPAP